MALPTRDLLLEPGPSAADFFSLRGLAFTSRRKKISSSGGSVKSVHRTVSLSTREHYLKQI